MYVKIYSNKGYNRNILIEPLPYTELGKPKKVKLVNHDNEYFDIIPDENGDRVVNQIYGSNNGVITDTKGIGKFNYGRYFCRIAVSPTGLILRVFNKYNKVNEKLAEKNIFFRPYVSEGDMRDEEDMIKIILHRFESECKKCKKCSEQCNQCEQCIKRDKFFMSNCIHEIINDIDFKDYKQKNIILSFFDHLIGNVISSKNYHYGRKMALSIFE